MSRADVFHGDAREILAMLADGSIDAVVTDPPYALVSIVKRFGGADAAPARDGDVYARASAGFMGRAWDTGETAFAAGFWREVWRVLKPGGHVVAFSGTRTYHRLACAIEDGGFEIRDMVAWLYGSGFPKSHDVERSIAEFLCIRNGRHYAHALPPADRRQDGDHICDAGEDSAEFDGLGTALKPALEPICLARKPLIGTVARTVLAHGTGALNIRACRVGTDTRSIGEKISENGSMAGANYAREICGEEVGRWPANVIHDGSDEVVAAFPDSDGGGEIRNRAAPKFGGVYGDFNGETERFAGYSDTGSAARFFYSAKADAEDRLGSDHPTVKPVDLMAWLIRLVCPPGGVVLDPFAGSGTTGLAAMREGCSAILIEREADHADDIRRRMAWAAGDGGLTSQEVLRHAIAKDPAAAMGADMPLFLGAMDQPEKLDV